jgi:hypothetical protein
MGVRFQASRRDAVSVLGWNRGLQPTARVIQSLCDGEHVTDVWTNDWASSFDLRTEVCGLFL